MEPTVVNPLPEDLMSPHINREAVCLRSSNGDGLSYSESLYCAMDRCLAIWKIHARTGRDQTLGSPFRYTCEVVQTSHALPITAIAVQSFAEGFLLFTGSADSTVKIWEESQGKNKTTKLKLKASLDHSAPIFKIEVNEGKIQTLSSNGLSSDVFLTEWKQESDRKTYTKLGVTLIPTSSPQSPFQKRKTRENVKAVFQGHILSPDSPTYLCQGNSYVIVYKKSGFFRGYEYYDVLRFPKPLESF